MRILLLHLSDFHFDATGANPVLQRTKGIASAVRGNIPATDAIFILATGDFVDKGNAGAYKFAQTFFEDLYKELRLFADDDTKIFTLMVPGNHDVCRPDNSVEIFTWNEAASKLLVQNKSIQPQSVECMICLRLQDPYSELVKAVTGADLEAEDRLFKVHRYEFESILLEFITVNSALLCKDDNDYGQLRAHIPSGFNRERDHAVRIFLMHHPVSWMHPSQRRHLESLIQTTADLVFTGHLHVRDEFVIKKSGFDHAFFEGSALAEVDGGFGAVLIDVEEKRRKQFDFRWTGSHYSCTPCAEWLPMRRDISGIDGFCFTEQFEQLIDEPGFAQPPDRNSVVLSDVFVYPRLKDLTLEMERRERTKNRLPVAPVKQNRKDPNLPSSALSRGDSVDPPINSADVIQSIEGHPNILIVGETRSGKSTLLRKYVRDFKEKGIMPILLKAGDLKSSDVDDLVKVIEKRAVEQYEGDPARYLMLPLSSRAILVDDFNLALSDSSKHRDLLHSFGKLASYTVLVADDLFLLKQVFAAFEAHEILKYRIYRLLDLDDKQIREMAHKMQSAIGGTTGNEAALVALDRNVGSILGERFVSPIPAEVKAVIRELLIAGSSKSYGAYGFYYDLQIKNDIAIGIAACSRESLEPQANVVEEVLSRLARLMFDSGRTDVSISALERIVRDLNDEFLSVELGPLLVVLKAGKILTVSEETIRFRERYQRYFFLAQHLKSLLEKSTKSKVAEEILTRLVDQLHDRESADIVLFTVYLTYNEWLLERLAERAESVFDGIEECSMAASEDDDSGSVSMIADGSLVSALEAHSPEREARGAELDSMVKSTLEVMAEGFNVMNILGLAVRNYPAKIEPALRLKMLHRGAAISLRSMTAFNNLINEGSPELDLLASRHLRVTTGGRSTGYLAAQLISLCEFGVIRRVVHAFAAPHLQPLLDQLWTSDVRIACRVTRFAMQLDLRRSGAQEAEKLYSEFSDNGNAKVVMKYIVANHLRAFRATRARRLPLCRAVEIDPDSSYFYYDPGKPKAIGGTRGR